MATPKGYDEQTLMNHEGREVYGQDGYGWYTYKDVAAQCFPKTQTRASKNTLFVYLEGMTKGKLNAKGFR